MNSQPYLDNVSSDSVNIITTTSPEEKELFFYPSNVGFLATRPPYAFDRNTLAAAGYIIVFTVSGTGILHYQGVDYLLDMYSVAFIPCNTDFRFSASNSDRRWRFLYLNYDGKQAKQYYHYIMGNKKPVGTIEGYKTIISLIWQIINRYKAEKREPFAGLNTYTNILEILAEIANLNAPVPYYNLACPTYITDLFYYIDRHYTEKITLDVLEQCFAISKYYIARQFKEYAGVTINEYIIQKRIGRAKFLLKHTDKTISDIAEEIGFYNSCHFINQFKAREFITPHAYRRAVKN